MRSIDRGGRPHLHRGDARLRRGVRCRRGQASVELAAGAGLLALLLAIGLAALSVSFDAWRAQGASYAGARAELIGTDGERRALRVLSPGRGRGRGAPGSRERTEAAEVDVEAGRARLRVELGRRTPLGRTVSRGSTRLDPLP